MYMTDYEVWKIQAREAIERADEWLRQRDAKRCPFCLEVPDVDLECFCTTGLAPEDRD